MTEKKAFPGLKGAFLLLILLYLIMGILGYLYVFLTGNLLEGSVAGGSAFITGILSSLSFLSVIFLGYKFTGRSHREVFPVKKMDPVFLLLCAFTCIGLVIVLSEVDNIFQNNIPIPDFFSDILMDLLTGDDIFQTAVLIGVIAPFTEELLFRGVILSGLVKNYKEVPAVLLSALLFSIFHLNPLQMTGAFIGGIFLAWILLKTQNILYSIASHSIFNLFPFIILRMTSVEIRGFTDIDRISKNYQPLWFDISGILILAAGIFFIHLYMKKYFSNLKNIN